MDAKVSLKLNSPYKVAALGQEAQKQPSLVSRPVSIDGVQTPSPAAVNVDLATKSDIAASVYNRRGASAREADAAAAEALKNEAPAEPPPSDAASPTFNGIARGNQVAFEGVLLTISKDNDVDVTIQPPKGEQIKGEGKLSEDGTIEVTLENGQSFRAKLKVSGEKATLSNLEVLKSPPPVQQQPVKAPPPAEPVQPSAPVQQPGVAKFDGVVLALHANGGVSAKITTPAGKEIKGRGVRDRNGKTLLALENGQKYSFRLELDGGRSKISDLKVINPPKGHTAERKVAEKSVSAA